MTKSTEKNKSKEKWKITNQRYVGFIDIMGFKDLVARSTHNEVYNLMKRIDEFQKRSSQIEWGGNKSKLVRITTYSDSIMVYSCSDSFDSAYSFICTIAALTHDLLTAGIPHKGSVAMGTMTMDNRRSIYFGQPIIDAYLLQEELKFYGIVIHGSAQKQMETHEGLVFTSTYLCPFKKGISEHMVIYPIYLKVKKYESKNKILFESIRKMKYSTSGNIRQYIDLTEKYVKSLNE